MSPFLEYSFILPRDSASLGIFNPIKVMVNPIKNNRSRLLFTLLFVLMSVAESWAQAPAPEADFMRSTGKIYVVVAVLVAIFVGILAFLVYLERKVTKLETQINDH